MTMGPVFFTIVAAVIGASQAAFPSCPCDYPSQLTAFLPSGFGSSVYSNDPSDGDSGADWYSHELHALAGLLRSVANVFLPVNPNLEEAWNSTEEHNAGFGFTDPPVVQDRSDSNDGAFSLWHVVESEQNLRAVYDDIKRRIGATDISNTLIDKVLDGSLNYMACLDSTLSTPTSRSVSPPSFFSQSRSNYVFNAADYTQNIDHLAGVIKANYDTTIGADCRRGVEFIEDYLRLLARAVTKSSQANKYDRITDYTSQIRSNGDLSDVERHSLLAVTALIEYLPLYATNWAGPY